MDQIEAVIAKNNLTSIKKFLPANNQAKMTMNYATEVNADLIIIMTDQDENLSGRLLGSYAQQIVNHSKIPVMSIQPNFGNADWGH
jgi:nucleotide-binding universal stress UspA family protein